MSTSPEVFLADCPARLAVELIAGKRTVVVLAGLSEGPVRHEDLVEMIGGISRKMLTQTCADGMGEDERRRGSGRPRRRPQLSRDGISTISMAKSQKYCTFSNQGALLVLSRFGFRTATADDGAQQRRACERPAVSKQLRDSIKRKYHERSRRWQRC